MSDRQALRKEVRILRRQLERSKLNRIRLEKDKDRSEAFHRRIIEALEETKHELHEEKQTAERLAKAKDELLANVSHDLRTPMTGILGIANLLQESSLGAQEQEWVDILLSSARGLLALLDDLLDLTKLDVGQLRLVAEPFCPAQLLRDQIALVKSEAIERGLELELSIASEVPDRVIGDPARVRQVLLNLLSNALRYTDAGGVKVRLEVETSEGPPPPDPNLQVVVRDTGRGIPAEHIEEIFELFFQQDAGVKRTNEGSGLGLAISRRLARALGGDVRAQSQLGQGSTFTFTFAAPADPEGQEPKEHPGGDGLKGLRILLVEDNPVNQLVVATQLRSLGAQVETVNDGESAVRATHALTWDLILMDCHLPGISGREASRQIRARKANSPTGQRLPILALTASALDGERQKCLEAGMDGFIAKPSQPQEILATIHEVLAHPVSS